MTTAALGLAALALVAGCDRSTPRAAPQRKTRPASANESAYHPAPAVDGVSRQAGRIVLSGRAQPGAPVRLSSPDRRVVTASASRRGRWSVVLPPSPEMRFYSLSMIDGGRVVQSDGYLAIAPELAGELRAGAGATTFGQPGETPRVTAVDFDSKGGCVVSGVAAPGQTVAVRIDGTNRGGARADASRRFSLALDEPIAPGSHTVEVVAGVARASVAIDVTPPGPMPSIPLRATRTGDGWRVDWTTPGGGLQTTLLFASPGGLE